MSDISRNILFYEAVFPRWLMALLIGGSLVAGTVLTFIESSDLKMAAPPPPIVAQMPAPKAIPPQSSGREPASVEPMLPKSGAEENEASPTNAELAQKVVSFGIAFCVAAGTISALILLVSVPVFLFSSNERRIARAGGLVKTTLGFFVGSAGALIATISFSKVL